jgi:asparagine synthase (glutamine-hydrolysing)
MCGILGTTKKISGAEFNEALRSMAHRGPDDTGIFSDENVTFGHCRLSIIDLSPSGHQPMKDESGDFVLSFNGEIYNFNELKKGLEDNGVVFTGKSDTEVILRGFKKEGKSFFSRLRGMWAIAIYSKKTGKVFLSRDHFGIKPIYYSTKDGVLRFSSELSAIKKLLKDINPNTESYYLFYNLGYFPGVETCYEEIKKVLPGEILTWSIEEKKLSKEFLVLDDNKADTIESFEDATEAIEKALEGSVEAHFVSDVPVSILLSGGTDSSLIASMSKKLNKNPKAYHISIPGSIDTEYARAVSKHLDLSLMEKEFDESALKSNYDEVLEWIDNPTSDVSVIPTSLVYKLIKGESKVVLSGEGGDEFFGGYVRHGIFSEINGLGMSRESFINSFFLTNDFGIRWINPFLNRIRNYIARMRRDMIGLYICFTNTVVFPMDEKKVRRYLANYHNDNFLKNFIPANLFFDLCMYLPDSLLYKNDISSMHSSIEARVPFVDREILLATLAIPSKFRLSPEYKNKAVLKKILDKYLPHDLVERPKKGFGFSFVKKKFFADDYERAVKFHLENAEKFGISQNLRKFLERSGHDLVARKFPRFAFSLITNWKIFTRND